MVGRRPDRFLMKWIAFLFTLFIIAIVVAADLGILPRYLGVVYDFPNGDKIGHFVLFGLLSFLLILTFIRSRQNRTSKLIALTTGLILALLIALEEFSQGFVATRTFSLVDLAASWAGVAFGGFAALKMNK